MNTEQSFHCEMISELHKNIVEANALATRLFFFSININYY